MTDTAEIITLDHADAPAARSRAVDFYELTKPRMNFLVVITTMVGFHVASHGRIDWVLMLKTILGTALCAASAGVLNQVIERDLDAKMPRTADRPLPGGRISPGEATIFGIAMGLAGMVVLAAGVNLLTALLGLVTIAWYLVIYTPAKRFTTLNTVIGAVPGAIPPLMGFTAAQGALSPAALTVFAVLFFWQMPHFLAIAIMYRDDYSLAGFKMLPCVDRELSITSRMIVLYAIVLIPVSLLPAMLGVAGNLYAGAALLLGFVFLSFAITCAVSRTRRDARGLFFSSIVYLPLLLGVMMLDKVG